MTYSFILPPESAPVDRTPEGFRLHPERIQVRPGRSNRRSPPERYILKLRCVGT